MTRAAERVARWLLAAVFVYAAVPKILDPAGFAQSIARYRLAPDAVVSPAAIVLPWVELVAAGALILGRRHRESAAVVLATLLLVFTFALVVTELRGLDIECGCFPLESAGRRIPFALLLGRDLGLLGLALLCARAAARPGRA